MARCSDPLRSVDYQRIWNPTIWKQDFLKVWFQMVRFFKRSGYSYCYSHSPNHLKTGPYEIQTFLSEIQIVFDKMAAICWFQMVGLLDFGSHSKSRPFEAQPLFDHSKSRLVWISDPHYPHCTNLSDWNTFGRAQNGCTSRVECNDVKQLLCSITGLRWTKLWYQ